jgi:hypothetical protein
MAWAAWLTIAQRGDEEGIDSSHGKIYTSDQLLTAAVGVWILWVIAAGTIFLMGGSRSTFACTKTAKEFLEDSFDHGNDATKHNVTSNKHPSLISATMRVKQTEWLIESWPKWKKENPAFFNANFKKTCDELVNGRDRRSSRSSNRRSDENSGSILNSGSGSGSRSKSRVRSGRYGLVKGR